MRGSVEKHAAVERIEDRAGGGAGIGDWSKHNRGAWRMMLAWGLANGEWWVVSDVVCGVW